MSTNRTTRERSRRTRMLRRERALWKDGLTRVAGVDEAGVGPLAGPVVAAAVVGAFTYFLILFAMVAYPITPQQGVSLSIGTGGNFGAGTDFDAITVGYQYSWGGS